MESQSRTLSEVIHKHSQFRDSVLAKARESSPIEAMSGDVKKEWLNNVDKDFTDG
jgi:hypothetical protein